MEKITISKEYLEQLVKIQESILSSQGQAKADGINYLLGYIETLKYFNSIGYRTNSTDYWINMEASTKLHKIKNIV